MRRLLFIVFSVALLAVLVGAVGAQETVELVIWGEGGMVTCLDEQSEEVNCIFTRNLQAGWEALHPEITLKWEFHGWDEELRQNLVTAELGGTAPDITVGESFMPALTREGFFLPLAISDDAMANIVPGTVLAVNLDGTLHGVATYTAVFALEVNADVVRQAGLDPDTLDVSTWSKVADVAAQITEAGNGEYYGFSVLGPTNFPAAALFRAAPYVYQTGGDFCDEGCVNPTFNDPRSVKVYEWFRQMYQLTPPGLAFNGDEGFVFSQLFQGETAMQTAGAWHPAWARSSGCTDCRYLPLPIPDEGGMAANVVVGNVIWSALASTDHPEEAMMFLEYLTSDDVQTDIFWSTGRMPSTFTSLQQILDVANGDTASVPEYYVSEDPVKDTAPFVGYITELTSENVRILPPWATKGPELNALWNSMFAEILTSSDPVEDILNRYQAEAEALVAE